MPNLDLIKSEFFRVLDEAQVIWTVGGWAMIAIAVIAFFMAAMGFHIYFNMRRQNYRRVSEKVWRSWIKNPEQRKGRLGALLNRVLETNSAQQMMARFDQIQAEETAPFERDLKVMKICVSAAPLVGLLGTVTGMLATFGALSTGSGGDQTMGMIADGISVALITTETGLVIALPGLFFHHFLVRKFHSFRGFLSHVQTVCAQNLHAENHQLEANQKLALQNLLATRKRMNPVPANWNVVTKRDEEDALEIRSQAS